MGRARAWKVCQLTRGVGEGVCVLLLIDCGTDFFLKSLESERCNWREVVQLGWVNFIRGSGFINRGSKSML